MVSKVIAFYFKITSLKWISSLSDEPQFFFSGNLSICHCSIGWLCSYTYRFSSAPSSSPTHWQKCDRKFFSRVSFHFLIWYYLLFNLNVSTVITEYFNSYFQLKISISQNLQYWQMTLNYLISEFMMLCADSIHEWTKGAFIRRHMHTHEALEWASW